MRLAYGIMEHQKKCQRNCDLAFTLEEENHGLTLCSYICSTENKMLLNGAHITQNECNSDIHGLCSLESIF